MIEYFKKIAHNVAIIELLLYLLLFTLPFGSFFLSFSIGFMTIYPHLILLLGVTFLGLFQIKKINKGVERYYLLFLLFWLAYAMCFLPFVASKSDAIIDIRSIGLMLLTSFSFIISSKILGYEKWRNIVLVMLKLFFFLVLFCSMFELLTGIHLEGAFTEKIIFRGIIDQYLYTPVFLWDNPNNLTTYLLLLGFLIVLLEKPSYQKWMIRWFILISCFFIAYLCATRIAIFLLIAISLGLGAYHIYFSLKEGYKKILAFALGMVVVLCWIFISMPKFYGPIWEEANSDSTLSEVEHAMMLDLMYNNNGIGLSKDKSKLIDGSSYNSNRIRFALFMNGIDYAKRSKLLGVGPGQFRYLHSVNDKKYFTSTNNGPHFWLIEVVSQYGVVIFILYISFLVWILITGIRLIKNNFDLFFDLMISLFVFAAASMLTSGFLILDINWIFVIILIIVSVNNRSLKTSNS